MRMPSGHFCGIRLNSDLVSDFTFIESLHLPNQKHSKHSHERASLCLVLQGRFTETNGRQSLTCAPSTLLFYPAGEAHAESFHNLRTRCFVIEINPPWLERLDHFSGVVNQPANFHGGKASGLAIRVYKEFCALDEFSNLAIEGLLLEMMAEISRSTRQIQGGPTARIELAKELVHAHFREPLTLAAIAEQVGLHPVYLAQAFRKACGCTVGEYVRRLRIEFACRELSNPDNPISKIAAAAGFFDQSHFTRTFKQLLGVTPAEFQRELNRH
jgi:AraC family transcriptional regulator